MTSITVQLPLVPAEVDLQDFAFMPVDVQRLLKSETWILASGDQRAAAITLWLQSWHQVPAGSLPDNDRMLAHLSGSLERWKKVREHALRGWVVCADGRLYHPVVCEKALEAWIEKLSNSMSGASGNAKRWGIEVDVSAIREQFRVAVNMLRALAPQSRTLKKKIVAVILSGSRLESGGDTSRDEGGEPDGDSRPDSRMGSPPDSSPDSSGDRKGQGQGQRIEKGERASSAPPFLRALAYEGASLAQQAAQAMQQAGYDAVVAEDPELLAVLAQGITAAELGAAAAVGRQRRKGPGWVFARAVGRRRDAAQLPEVLPAAGGQATTVPPGETTEQYLQRIAAEKKARCNEPPVTTDVKALAAQTRAKVKALRAGGDGGNQGETNGV